MKTDIRILKLSVSIFIYDSKLKIISESVSVKKIFESLFISDDYSILYLYLSNIQVQIWINSDNIWSVCTSQKHKKTWEVRGLKAKMTSIKSFIGWKDKQLLISKHINCVDKFAFLIPNELRIYYLFGLNCATTGWEIEGSSIIH